MMTLQVKSLPDDSARRRALSVHDRSLLVEAGAGSGKTAVMAGRIALMLAEGIAPKSIAAVTFTELAASELLIRVRDFVNDLVGGTIPPEMRVALPEGLSATQITALSSASAAIDEITCSTIHGFCQRLIKPYPVEADIDPGAAIMDSGEGELIFREISETWLRQTLSGETAGLVSEIVLHDVEAAVGLVHKILSHLRRRRTIAAPVPQLHLPLIQAFLKSVSDFEAFVTAVSAKESETLAMAEDLKAMAAGVTFALTDETPAGLIRLLVAKPHESLCTKGGAFAAYRKKGKWADAAKRAGLSKADADRLNDAAAAHCQAAQQSWTALQEAVASRILADLIREVRPVVNRFQSYKREVGLLDFDDLIFAARDLLRGHPEVRAALAGRYAHVLVDEFQDTDPLQTEIFWRLCGERPEGASSDRWQDFLIRPGALFLVGDPKQAIYRFRGADVAAYVSARNAFKVMDIDSILPISTNFRSRAPILHYVNACFEAALSLEGQPGFTRLDPFHSDADGAACVVALDVTIETDTGKATVDQRRDAEAEAVAEMCARLIAGERIVDRKTGQSRPVRPGDIALLAPSGSDLWRYEIALERYRIPVATQAGKGLFKRQEIQDLIAVARVLADGRDTLALGALLRGPLVGLTDEQLLDIVWGLPRPDDAQDRLPRLTLHMPTDAINNPLARDIVEKLQALRRRAHATTPHEILSQAIDVLRVRPILLARHRGQAERVLSNVDLFLSFAKAYAVRGLRAFAETMRTSWEDEERAVEGRPDAQEESVALYTMHASKGLEWPIVVPINTMTTITYKETAVIDRETEQFYCPVFGVAPTGYAEAREAEKAELERERVRLWYVAATRARELLVVPRANIPAGSSTWISLVDLTLDALPTLDLSKIPAEIQSLESPVQNEQTRAIFASEASAIADLQPQLKWLAPSRDEGAVGPAALPEAPVILRANEDGESADPLVPILVQGGRKRGLILHKLLEEVLTGETADKLEALTERASDLIRELEEIPTDDAANGLSARELVGCVSRTLALPEIAALRPTLIPELPVYASEVADGVEMATSGIADAIGHIGDGMSRVVVDWKSDVAPEQDVVDHYRAQVASYLRSTGADYGLIVFVTTGVVLRVTL